MPTLAEAYPTKQFFLEMFTRDISLEDCILDLVDNSVDALIRTKRLPPSTALLMNSPQGPLGFNGAARIDISLSPNEFKIADNCGGIEPGYARREAFRFGHKEPAIESQLGAYGIGLKRAIFKIGTRFRMRSRHPQGGFEVDLDVAEWAARDSTLNDWSIPMRDIPAAENSDTAGTSITITNLRPEVKLRLQDTSLQARVISAIAQTYTLFLDRHVCVAINATPIQADPIPMDGQRKLNRPRTRSAVTALVSPCSPA